MGGIFGFISPDYSESVEYPLGIVHRGGEIDVGFAISRIISPPFKHKIMSRQLRKRRSRRGTAAAECAFCIPLILLLTFSTLEICSAIFVKETLTVAAYEGARVGVKRKATRLNAYNQVVAVLEARGVVNYEVNITPSDFSTLDQLDLITINVQAPGAGNSFFIGQFLNGRWMSSTVRMVREFDE